MNGFGSNPKFAANDKVIGVIIIAVAAFEAISVKIIDIKRTIGKEAKPNLSASKIDLNKLKIDN